MKRTLMISAASILMFASSTVWAAGPNDGPKYPVSTSNKHYTDQRIMDHNNGAPRYAVTSNPNKQFTDKRIMDHNNGAPRYPVTASGSQPQVYVPRNSKDDRALQVAEALRRGTDVTSTR